MRKFESSPGHQHPFRAGSPRFAPADLSAQLIDFIDFV
jgi:hypothetical protein